MKKITPIIDRYTVRKSEVLLQNLEEPQLLKEKIKLSKCFLQKVRLHLRNNEFESIEDEIHFFKFIKPQLCGELLFYNIRLAYLVETPYSTICRKIAFIKSKLKKLESKKKKNIAFYIYYKHTETAFDDKYFVRNNGQLNLSFSEESLCSDPEFTTSHDMLASEVITYDLLTQFYREGLEKLKNKNISCPDVIPEK